MKDQPNAPRRGRLRDAVAISRRWAARLVHGVSDALLTAEWLVITLWRASVTNQIDERCHTHRPLPSLRQLRIMDARYGVNWGETPDRLSPDQLGRLARLAKECDARRSDEERAAVGERELMVAALESRTSRLRTDLCTTGGHTWRRRQRTKRELRALEEHLESIERSQWHDVALFRFCSVVLEAMSEENGTTSAGGPAAISGLARSSRSPGSPSAAGARRTSDVQQQDEGR